MTVPSLSLFLALALSSTPLDGPGLIRRAIEAHGVERLRTARVEFVFRGERFAMARRQGRFLYERLRQTVNGRRERLVLGNEGAGLFLNGRPVNVPPDQLAVLGENLNSVVYFASLPLPLLDAAVQVERRPDQAVGGVQYQVLKVRFREEGGGSDHDDEFRYWLDRQTGLIAFMAYSYGRNEGGVRFRVPIKKHEVEGVVFTDWANFGNEDERTPLDELPQLWEAGTLPKLSEIVLEQIRIERP
ncbi:MAG: DUF6503 family protein [Myxococcota bacterium]